MTWSEQRLPYPHSASTTVHAARDAMEIRGRVVSVLKGCGLADVEFGGHHHQLTVNRGTDGIHFNDLRVGQMISCEMSAGSKRVIHAHQQTMPRGTAPSPKVLPPPPLTTMDFDISKYFVGGGR